jgi:hypothetical protein
MTQPASGCGASIDLPLDLTPQALDDFDGEVMQHILGDIAVLAVNCSCLDYITAAQIDLLLRACHVAKEGDAVIALPSAPTGLISVLKAIEIEACFDAEASAWHAESPTAVPCTFRDQFLTHEFTLAAESVNCTAAKVSSLLSGVDGDTAHIFEWKTLFHAWITVLRAISELNTSQQITLIASTFRERLSVSIIDPGETLNLCDKFTNVEFREAVEVQNHPAMNMALVQQLANSITYERSDNANTHTLEKSLYKTRPTTS